MSIDCHRCGGTGKIDAGYCNKSSDERDRCCGDCWDRSRCHNGILEGMCPDCGGSGTKNLYRNDDGTYSDTSW